SSPRPRARSKATADRRAGTGPGRNSGTTRPAVPARAGFRAVGRAEPYYGPVTSPGYLRYPHIANDLVGFVAADDVWLAPPTGGRAWRFTADEAQAATPRLTPDGTHVAWVGARDGGPEIYVASLADGTSTRLTYWGTSWARVSGWTPAEEVLAVSEANQPFF